MTLLSPSPLSSLANNHQWRFICYSTLNSNGKDQHTCALLTLEMIITTLSFSYLWVEKSFSVNIWWDDAFDASATVCCWLVKSWVDSPIKPALRSCFMLLAGCCTRLGDRQEFVSLAVFVAANQAHLKLIMARLQLANIICRCISSWVQQSRQAWANCNTCPAVNNMML